MRLFHAGVTLRQGSLPEMCNSLGYSKEQEIRRVQQVTSRAETKEAAEV